jgi:hypothetical protein
MGVSTGPTELRCPFTLQQGDQNGRIFAYGAIVWLGQFFNYSFFNFEVKVMYLFWHKNAFGYILGDFFRSSSDQPAQRNK